MADKLDKTPLGLQMLRVAMGLTQIQLAYRMGYNGLHTWHQIERGIKKFEPYHEHLLRIAMMERALELGKTDFLDEKSLKMIKRLYRLQKAAALALKAEASASKAKPPAKARRAK